MSEKSFYLIDASSYIYRAFFAIKSLTNSKGMPTNAIHGFCRMLFKVLRERKPDYICLVFDSPGENYRHELYVEYKGTRQSMPEDLSAQIPRIHDIVKHYGLPKIEIPGFEADDIIASYARWAAARGIQVVIVSGDKDLFQLIEDPAICQWDPQKDKVFDEAGVMERFGVSPRQMKDYQALVGDSIDNIPGVKGIGEKTATQLLRQWTSLEGVYENIDKVGPPSVRKKLEEGREQAFLSRRLVELEMEAPIPESEGIFIAAAPQVPELCSIYAELELKALLDELVREWGEPEGVRQTTLSPTPERLDRTVRSPEELAVLVAELAGQRSFSIKFETSSPDPMLGHLVGIALCWAKHSAWYIPLAHTAPGKGEQLREEDVLEALAPFLSDVGTEKLGQNIKREWVYLMRRGIPLHGVGFDTMVASYLLQPGSHSHGLDRVAAEHLGEVLTTQEDVTGKGRERKLFEDADPAKAACHSCEDVEATWRLTPVLREKLALENLQTLYTDLELPLIEVLARMEYRGIGVDSARLEDLSIEFEKAINQRADSIYQLCGEEFNIGSPKQLSVILFEKLGLRSVKKTKSGLSTDATVLEELAGEHPVIEHILMHRTLCKLKGTYADALGKLINPETGRIHTSFNQTVAATGRLSSSDPNLQNIPIRSDEGKKIRKAFVPEAGHVLLSADYSQIELRILAHYSRDESLLEAFRIGQDIHRRTAAEMFGFTPEMVTPEMRRQAKMINFGIIYGMGAFGLAQRLRISNKIAKASIERYFQRYSGVHRFIQESVEKARSTGMTETLLGRKRAIPELQSRNHTIRQLGERLAINTPIQGTAADLIKKAMIDVEEALERSGLETRMLLQVHDELVFEVPERELEAATKLIKSQMEGVWELLVPLGVDVGYGCNWSEAHA